MFNKDVCGMFAFRLEHTPETLGWGQQAIYMMITTKLCFFFSFLLLLYFVGYVFFTKRVLKEVTTVKVSSTNQMLIYAQRVCTMYLKDVFSLYCCQNVQSRGRGRTHTHTNS